MHLSAEQIGFFKSNGYLLVPGAMDVDLCAQVRDDMWAALPKNVAIERDDPDTHAGPFAERTSGRALCPRTSSTLASNHSLSLTRLVRRGGAAATRISTLARSAIVLAKAQALPSPM